MKENIKTLLLLIILFLSVLMMCGSCTTQRFCPAYQDNYQAMEHRFNKWNGNKVHADYCKPPKKKKSKF